MCVIYRAASVLLYSLFVHTQFLQSLSLSLSPFFFPPDDTCTVSILSTCMRVCVCSVYLHCLFLRLLQKLLYILYEELRARVCVWCVSMKWHQHHKLNKRQQNVKKQSRITEKYFLSKYFKIGEGCNFNF